MLMSKFGRKAVGLGAVLGVTLIGAAEAEHVRAFAKAVAEAMQHGVLRAFILRARKPAG